MLKIPGRVTNYKKLDSIDDLKEINFGQSMSKHSLVLLHWFANMIDINQKDDMLFLKFFPSNGDYGFRIYSNSEGLLDKVERGHIYYTVGNLHQERLHQETAVLPDYVVKSPQEYMGSNRDRIIVKAMGLSVNQVYITQLQDDGKALDPHHTYQITTKLLGEIKKFSVTGEQPSLLQLRKNRGINADDLQLRRIRNTWGYVANVGLFLFIVIGEKSKNKSENRKHLQNEYSALILIIVVAVVAITIQFFNKGE